MLKIASAGKSAEIPKQKHSLLQRDHDRGQDRERGEIRRNTQANTPSKNTRSYRKQITLAKRK